MAQVNAASNVTTDNFPVASAYDAGSGTLVPVAAGAILTDAQHGSQKYASTQVQLTTPTPTSGHVILDANTVATYAFAITGLAPAASATDIFAIGGSASKVIRIMRVVVSASSNSAVAATNDLQLIFRSGGTQSAGTAGTPVLYDTNDPAVAATVYTYTSNPASVGTSLGVIYSAKLTPTLSPYTATDFPTQAPIIVQFGITDSKPVVLRGATQFLAINLNATSMTGTASIDLHVEWTESAS